MRASQRHRYLAFWPARSSRAVYRAKPSRRAVAEENSASQRKPTRRSHIKGEKKFNDFSTFSLLTPCLFLRLLSFSTWSLPWLSRFLRPQLAVELPLLDGFRGKPVAVLEDTDLQKLHVCAMHSVGYNRELSLRGEVPKTARNVTSTKENI